MEVMKIIDHSRGRSFHSFKCGPLAYVVLAGSCNHLGFFIIRRWFSLEAANVVVVVLRSNNEL